MKATGILLFTALLFLISGCAGSGNAVFSGTFEAEEVDVSALGTGRIVEIMVEEGTQVRKGEALLAVDHELLSLQRDQARFALASLGEKIKGLEKNLETAEVNFERVSRLYQEGTLSKARYDEAENAYVGAKSALQGALMDAERLKKEAAVLEKQIRDSIVKAPREGTVTEILYKEGEYVRAGSIVLSLADLRTLDIRFYVPEKDLEMIRVGAPVEIIPDAMPDAVYRGRITTVARESEFTPKNVQSKDERVLLVYKVEAEVENSDGKLKTGMNGDIIIPVKAEDDESSH
ncbi:MAG TPA: efflux RND transporter periplasmic adaptor subunit [Candidatus Mcinerneyibacteriales bacterium]|nr:efflux RND transporter periplasmic adaptor subunit [Candidatus Mcinerneyibacteriales bacterium]